MKNKIKIVISISLVAILLIGSRVFAAGEGIKKSIQVVMNAVNLMVDGQTIQNDNFIYNGTTYVPIRAIAEKLGKEVEWDAETYTVKIDDKDTGFIEKNGIKVFTKAVKYKGDYTEVNLKIPVIEGMKNAKLMNRLNHEFEKKTLDLKTEVEEINREVAEEAIKEGYPLRPGCIYTEFTPRLNDNGTMSISVLYYQYTGGAHGNNCQETVNLDLENEKELTLRDLFDSSKDYLKVLNDQLLKHMQNDLDNIFEDTLSNFQASDDLKFYLTDDAIVFYFDPYEIAPYSSGILEYQIPYKSLENILNKNYAKQLLKN